MRRSIHEHLEPTLRPHKDFDYDGEIVGIFGDTLHVRINGSRKIIPNVRRADHIRKEALYVGLKCKIKGLRERGVAGRSRGAKILTDIMPQQSGANFAYAFIPQAPLVYVAVNCEESEWLVNWDAVDGADVYEVYWARDDEGAGEALITMTRLREESVPFDEEEPPRIYFAVRAQAGLKSGAYSAWVTDPDYLGSMPLVSFGDAFNHGEVMNVTSLYRLNEDDEIEWSTDEGAAWEVVLDEDLPWPVTRQKIVQADPSFIYAHRHSSRYGAKDGDITLSLDAGVTWLSRPPAPAVDPWGGTAQIEDISFIQILEQESLVEVVGEAFDSGDLSISVQLPQVEWDKNTPAIISRDAGGVLTDDNTNYRVDYFRGRIFLIEDGSSAADVLPDEAYSVDYTYKTRRWIAVGKWLDGANQRGAIWRSDDQHGRYWTQYSLRNESEVQLQPIWAALNATRLLVTCWADDKLWLHVYNAEDLSFIARYDFGECSAAELAIKDFILYPATVEDDDDLFHVYGRVRTYPGEPE